MSSQREPTEPKGTQGEPRAPKASQGRLKGSPMQPKAAEATPQGAKGCPRVLKGSQRGPRSPKGSQRAGKGAPKQAKGTPNTPKANQEEKIYISNSQSTALGGQYWERCAIYAGSLTWEFQIHHFLALPRDRRQSEGWTHLGLLYPKACEAKRAMSAFVHFAYLCLR